MDRSTFRAVCEQHDGYVEITDDVTYCRDAEFEHGRGQFRWTDGYLKNQKTGRAYCERDTDEAATAVGTTESRLSGLSHGESVGHVTRVEEEQVMVDEDQIDGDADRVAEEIAMDGDDVVMVVGDETREVEPRFSRL